MNPSATTHSALGSLHTNADLTSLLGENSSAGNQAGATGAVPFAETLNQMLADVSHVQAGVQQQSLELAQGNTDSIQEVAINAAKADLAFQFVLEVRNRLIATYQEVMRMQI